MFEWAARLSEEYQAELTLVHVISGDQTWKARGEMHETLERLQQTAGARALVRVVTGEVAKVVAGLGGELRADLLVIGRKAASGVLGRLDMTAYSIIRQSPCPVVSV